MSVRANFTTGTLYKMSEHLYSATVLPQAVRRVMETQNQVIKHRRLQVSLEKIQ